VPTPLNRTPSLEVITTPLRTSEALMAHSPNRTTSLEVATPPGKSPFVRTIPAAVPPFVKATLDINAKYSELGGEAGFGKATSDLQQCPDGIGFFIHYGGGSIYWSPSTSAHEVHGDNRVLWAQLGWERSFLGYPVTDETKTPDGVGRFNHFQGGSAYWTPGTGAHEVHGAIRDKWASMGWEKSLLGYPLTNENPTPDGVGRFNHFQGGSVYWTPGTGAHEVHGSIRDKWASMGWERSFLGYPITDEMSGDAGARINDFQHGSITWSAETGPIPNPQTMHFHDDVVTQDWAPIGGWIDVVVSLKGDFTFIGHMHDSGFPNIGYTLGIVVMAPSGIGYGLSHSGHVDGTITIFGRNRDDDWTDTGNNPHIADNWRDVTQARLFWRLVSSDTLSSGVQGLLEDVAKDAVKALGAAGVSALIALI
jgi:LGFP repeat